MGLRRNKKLTRLTGESGGPVGQVSRGLGARAPRAWGPPKPLKLRFFANLLVVGAGEGVGVG